MYKDLILKIAESNFYTRNDNIYYYFYKNTFDNLIYKFNINSKKLSLVHDEYSDGTVEYIFTNYMYYSTNDNEISFLQIKDSNNIDKDFEDAERFIKEYIENQIFI